MNELKWRLQMRKLRQPLAPRQDLWVGIEAALDDAARQDAAQGGADRAHRRRRLVGAGLAASILLATGILWRVAHVPPVDAAGSLAANAPRWKPADPRLSGAAIELDAARMELQLALQQAPDSAALQRLLGRTKQQQNQLRHLASQPG